MAKLSRDRESFTKTIRTDLESWNPPVNMSSSQPKSQRNMPPPLPPSKTTHSATRVPNTPQSQREQDPSAHEETQLSSKKQKRFRRRQNRKQDSFSDQNTSVSGETSSVTRNRDDGINEETVVNHDSDGQVYVRLETRFKTVQDQQQERMSISSQQKDEHGMVKSTNKDTISQKQGNVNTNSYDLGIGKGISSLPVRVNGTSSPTRSHNQASSSYLNLPPNASQSSSTQGRPSSQQTIRSTISKEEQPVFDKEPEMFGVYEESDVEMDGDKSARSRIKMEQDEDADAASVPKQRSKLKSPRKEVQVPSLRDESKSDALPRKNAAVEEDNRLETHNNNTVVSDDSTTRPQVVSNVVISDPPRLQGGKFACPYAAAYDCDKSFQSRTSAIRHADLHVNADKYKCSVCEKGFSREDLLNRHAKIHEKDTAKSKSASQTKSAAGQSRSRSKKSGNNDTNVTKEDGSEDGVSDRLDTVRSSVEYLAACSIVDQDEPAIYSTDTEANRKDEIGQAVEDQSMEGEEEIHETINGQNDGDNATSDDAKTASSKSMSRVTRSTRSLKRKQPSPPLQLSKDDSPRPRKRTRKDKENSSGSQRAPERSTQTQVRREDPLEADVEMVVDSAESAAPIQAEQDDTSEAESSPHPEAPKIQVRVPVLKSTSQNIDFPKLTSTSNIIALKGNQTSTRSTGMIPRNKTLDSFIERSVTRSESREGSQSKSGHKTAFAAVETGQSSKSRTKRKVQSTLTTSDQSKSRKRDSANKAQKSQEAIESSAGSEDRPKATTVARRSSVQKGKGKLATFRDKESSQDEDENSQSNDEDSDGPDETKNPYHRNMKDKSKRKPRAPQGTRTGRFSDEEVAVLHAWRDSFCDLHSMDIYAFNEMMAASMKRQAKGEEWRRYQNFISKREFLDQYYEQLPDRDRRAMIRFRERHFVNVEKNAWTEEDDEELKRLVKECGSKWVEIAEMMGRTTDSVHQRWRHKLNYGEKIAEGEWTDKETEKLNDIITEIAEKQDKDPDDSDLEVQWKVVSKRLGNGRTAQQCSNRWRITTHKRTEKGFVRVPHADRIPLLKTGPRTPSRMAKRLTGKKKPTTTSVKTRRATKIKSAEVVKDSEDEGDDKIAVPTSDNDEQASATDAEESESKSGEDDEASEQRSTSDEEADVESAAESDEDGRDTDEEKSSSIKPKQVLSSRKRKLNPVSEDEEEQPRRLKTPRVPRKPFKTNTPANAPSLSQLYDFTQATSTTRPTTGRRSRVPDTEVRPERPSPVNSVRQRPISSPLDMLAQVAVEQQAEDGAEEEEEASNSEDSSDSLAESKQEADGDEEPETESASDSDSQSGSGSGSGSATSSQVDDSQGESSDASDPDGTRKNRVRAGERSQEEPTSTQGGFWDSVNSFRSLLPFSQKSSSSQQATKPSQKGRKSQIMNALRGLPSKDDSSDGD